MSARAAILLLVSACAGAASAQDLRGRLQEIEDGDVTFSFDARNGVCGDGEVIVHERVGEGRSVSYVGRNATFDTDDRDFDNLDSWCRPGPVHVRMTRSQTRVTDLQLAVGPAVFTEAHSLGEVTPGEAVELLVNDIARAGDRRVARRALHAAAMADAESWPAFLVIARDSTLDSSVRRGARQWLARDAAELLLARAPVLDDATEVKRHAVFALSRRKDDRSRDALWEIAESGDDLAIRSAAVFWLGLSDDPRALGMLEAVLREG